MSYRLTLISDHIQQLLCINFSLSQMKTIFFFLFWGGFFYLLLLPQCFSSVTKVNYIYGLADGFCSIIWATMPIVSTVHIQLCIHTETKIWRKNKQRQNNRYTTNRIRITENRIEHIVYSTLRRMCVGSKQHMHLKTMDARERRTNTMRHKNICSV